MMHNQIKIVHILHDLRVGGQENGVVNLVNGLNHEHFSCSIYSLRKPDKIKDKVHERNSIRSFNKRQGNNLRIIFQISRMLKTDCPLIVHTHAWGTLLEGFIAAKLAKVPIWVHGEHGTIQTRGINVLVQRFFWKFAKQILTVSNNHRTLLSQTIGVPTSDIMAIQNGVDLRQYKPKKDASALKEHFGIPPHHVVVGSIGRLVEVKQYHIFVEALASIIKNKANVSGMLVGDGPLRQDLECQAQKMGISNRLHFLGRRDDVSRILHLLDIFVLTSRSEGMSNTILEAMASGLPVVATDVGGTNELVVHGETGFLVPPQNPARTAEAVTDILLDQDTRRIMGENGLKRVESFFGLDRMIHAYEKLYLNLAENYKRAS